MSASEIAVGNAAEVSGGTRGWFTRPEWSPPSAVRTLNVLIRGRFVLRFPDREVELAREGDFVLFGPGVAHSFHSLEESLVLTVRWPSAPPA